MAEKPATAPRQLTMFERLQMDIRTGRALPPEDKLSSTEVATYLGISVMQVNALGDMGCLRRFDASLPSSTVPYWRYYRDSVLEFEESRREGSESKPKATTKEYP